MNMEFIEQLTRVFEEKQNPVIAVQQKSYMKDRFAFYGIKTPTRRMLQKPFLDKIFLPPKNELSGMIKILWQKPQREYQYFAQELVSRYHKNQEEKDLALYVYMITHKSWWDTVDFIATILVGSYFKKFPLYKNHYVQEWISSGSIWLQRTALLFQMKYKNDLETVLLAKTIKALNGSKEFFINKAIGWILRAYSKSNPGWVQAFINEVPLSGLSRREAGKYL